MFQIEAATAYPNDACAPFQKKDLLIHPFLANNMYCIYLSSSVWNRFIVVPPLPFSSWGSVLVCCNKLIKKINYFDGRTPLSFFIMCVRI